MQDKHHNSLIGCSMNSIDLRNPRFKLFCPTCLQFYLSFLIPFIDISSVKRTQFHSRATDNRTASDRTTWSKMFHVVWLVTCALFYVYNQEMLIKRSKQLYFTCLLEISLNIYSHLTNFVDLQRNISPKSNIKCIVEPTAENWLGSNYLLSFSLFLGISNREMLFHQF